MGIENKKNNEPKDNFGPEHVENDKRVQPSQVASGLRPQLVLRSSIDYIDPAGPISGVAQCWAADMVVRAENEGDDIDDGMACEPACAPVHGQQART